MCVGNESLSLQFLVNEGDLDRLVELEHLLTKVVAIEVAILLDWSVSKC
jgi:hypothetical protein